MTTNFHNRPAQDAQGMRVVRAASEMGGGIHLCGRA